jgi:2'-5' RNA ligase
VSARLYVVSFPVLAAPDELLLRGLRARYHPTQADRIGPHFTFVFALPESAQPALAAQMQDVAAITAPIAFTLHRVEPIADAAAGMAFIALVPHRGHLAMLDLHRRLYEGPLEGYREPATRFEPHLTVAMLDTADESVADIAERIAAHIRDSGAAAGISGRLTELVLVAETGEAIMERLRVPLAGGIKAV